MNYKNEKPDISRSNNCNVHIIRLLKCSIHGIEKNTVKNEGILSKKIAALFPLGGSSVLLILITALVGAVVGGLEHSQAAT
jgi:hypothetical protein